VLPDKNSNTFMRTLFVLAEDPSITPLSRRRTNVSAIKSDRRTTPYSTSGSNYNAPNLSGLKRESSPTSTVGKPRRRNPQTGMLEGIILMTTLLVQSAPLPFLTVRPLLSGRPVLNVRNHIVTGK
jgi:hypothetical protein